MQLDRRKYPRSPSDPGAVCTCTSADFAGRDGDHYNLATRLLDVSRRGACIVTVGRLREKAPVLLDVTVPRTLGRFKAKAEVRWSVTLEKNGRTAHVAGLRFDRVLESTGGGEKALSGDAVPPPSHEPQRRFKRFAPKVLALECDPHDFRRMIGLGSNPAVRLKDLSQGGAQLVLSRPLKPGAEVGLSFELPAVRGTVAAQAKVRWCRRDTLTLERRWNAGLVFLRMSPEDELRLKVAEEFHIG